MWMNYFLFLLIILFLPFGGCKSEKQPEPVAEEEEVSIVTRDRFLDGKAAYNISSLEKYADTNSFHFQILYQPLYGEFSVINGKFANGRWGLCIKKPFEYYNPADPPQEELLYQIFCQIAQEDSLQLFHKLDQYNNGNIVNDVCMGCYHHEGVEIEILDSGRYSFYKKDHVTGNDSLVVQELMGLFGLGESENIEK